MTQINQLSFVQVVCVASRRERQSLVLPEAALANRRIHDRKDFAGFTTIADGYVPLIWIKAAVGRPASNRLRRFGVLVRRHPAGGASVSQVSIAPPPKVDQGAGIVAGRADQFRVLALSALAFGACFAVWTIFGIIGARIQRDPGLNQTARLRKAAPASRHRAGGGDARASRRPTCRSRLACGWLALVPLEPIYLFNVGPPAVMQRVRILVAD